MEYNEVLLGKDLRKFIMELLKSQDSYPKLKDYLASLWAVAENYRNIEMVNFALIAQLIEEAFNTSPRKINWNIERKIAQKGSLKITEQENETTKGYLYFEENIRNQLLQLKEMQRWFSKPIEGWKNLTTEVYLERGTVGYEFDDEVFDVDWSELDNIIHEGKYNE